MNKLLLLILMLTLMGCSAYYQKLQKNTSSNKLEYLSCDDLSRSEKFRQGNVCIGTVSYSSYKKIIGGCRTSYWVTPAILELKERNISLFLGEPISEWGYQYRVKAKIAFTSDMSFYKELKVLEKIFLPAPFVQKTMLDCLSLKKENKDTYSLYDGKLKFKVDVDIKKQLTTLLNYLKNKSDDGIKPEITRHADFFFIMNSSKTHKIINNFELVKVELYTMPFRKALKIPK